jgi:DNA-binding transcriptional regulator YiaG/uncharacterized phage-associated protein
MKSILSPVSEKTLTVQFKKEKIPFRKEEFEVVYHFYEDEGHQFTTDETDEVTVQQVYNQYREKYKLPFPEQIQAIREKYQVSASKMSEVLGFGINVYRQYESGEVPNQSNARLIQLANDPEEFRKLILLSDAFNEKEQEKVLKRVNTLIEQEKLITFDNLLSQYVLGNIEKLTSKNGYKQPTIQKTIEVICYLVEKLKPWNKLLFYSDFLHYRNYGVALMGLEYRAIQHGTVPTNYEMLLAYTTENGYIQAQQQEFPNGYTGEQFFLGEDNKVNESNFSLTERQTLEKVIELFTGKTTKQIVEINHKESAWIENQELKGIVDYGYGFELRV